MNHNSVPRIRMFAGPNGSGKSTIKSLLSPSLLGIYVNPDDIQREIIQSGSLNFAHYKIEVSFKKLEEHFKSSTLVKRTDLLKEILDIEVNGLIVSFKRDQTNSYLAAILSDFIRQQLVHSRQSFTFETVMSSVDKIELLCQARQLGYRIYLYYIATEDPEINIWRVKRRVQLGGHDVPKDKIVTRYHRSLDLLFKAIRNSDRAYVFDNSDVQYWIAEITDGKILDIKSEMIPEWFKKAVWEKISQV